MWTLDRLAREYPAGSLVRTGKTWWQVLGVTWSLPQERGGADSPAIVAQTQRGHRQGHLLPDEVDEYRRHA
jgi:hypothetical protein